jgi:hypothetical protein
MPLRVKHCPVLDIVSITRTFGAALPGRAFRSQRSLLNVARTYMSDRKGVVPCFTRHDHLKASTRSSAALSTLLFHITGGVCILTLVERVFTSRYAFILLNGVFPILHVFLSLEAFRPHAHFVDTIIGRVQLCLWNGRNISFSRVVEVPAAPLRVL